MKAKKTAKVSACGPHQTSRRAVWPKRRRLSGTSISGMSRTLAGRRRRRHHQKRRRLRSIVGHAVGDARRTEDRLLGAEDRFLAAESDARPAAEDEVDLVGARVAVDLL